MGTEKNIIKDSKGSGGIIGMTNQKSALVKFLHFFSPSLTADSKESCTSLVACMPVEIFMRQVVWASISKGSVMVSFKWFTIAWTCSSSPGGIVGMTNQKSALVRWTLTRHFLSSFSSAMNDRAGITSTGMFWHSCVQMF
jgi:hypothetical protein